MRNETPAGQRLPVAVSYFLVYSEFMPVTRKRNEEEEYKPRGKDVTTALRITRPKRATKPAAYTTATLDDLPFPDGAPTEPVHHALIEFCGHPIESIALGTVDNLIMWLFFETKRSTYRHWTLRVAPLPSRKDFSSLLAKKDSRCFWRLTPVLEQAPYSQWKSLAEPVVERVASAVSDQELQELLKSDNFIQ